MMSKTLAVFLVGGAICVAGAASSGCSGNQDSPVEPNKNPSGAGGSSSSTSATGGNSGAGAGSSTSSSGGSVPGDLNDPFNGSGELQGYTTNNPNALPDVTRADGRYRANLTDNTNDVTLHFNDSQGRLDAKLVNFPFEVIVRNIGIGTQGDSQTAPAPSGNPYIFAGVQVHVTDLNSRNSSHVVVGHRGETHFTVEGKNTVNGNSTVNDAGANIVPAGRADIRIVGHEDRTLSVYWQTPNPSPASTADSWTAYNGDGRLPGQAPAYGESVYVGLITYAFGYGGIPFVGTADAIEAP